jgi:hypothetical protein
MKIKWNWGTKLFIAMALFLIMLMTFVYMTTLQDHPLVEEEYYQKSLQYQDKLNKIDNAKKLDESVKVELGDKYLTIIFQPFFIPEKLSGTIQIYRPSDPDFDINIRIKPDSNGALYLPVEKLHKGKYIVKIDYTYEGKGYYEEKSIFVN